MSKRTTIAAKLAGVSLPVFIIMGTLFINGCNNKAEKTATEGKPVTETEAAKTVAKKGDTVKVQYTGTLADGSVFDKSQAESPLEFTLGGGQIIPGFEKAVEGMALNEEKKIVLKAEDAYGQRNDSLTKEFPLTFFPKDFKPEKGLVVRLQDQSGRAVPATIIDMTETGIKVDLNHPLAGKELTFDIKLVGIQ